MLSLRNKKWTLRNSSLGKVNDIACALDIPPVVAQLLVNRKIETVKEASVFIKATLSSLHDPFLIKGMELAVERILRAIKDKESIRLFCDYDVDGVTSAAFLAHFFRDIGISVGYYLPERMKEGYGLNEDAMKLIRKEGASLMITADCGITAVNEVELALSLGLDVIITDHHQVGSQGLPNAVAVLNPQRSDCQYPYRFLSGVGLAFKLALAVRTSLHKKMGWNKSILPNMKRHLDLVALGTIADVAPLTGENHVLVRHGLKILTTTDKAGLVALKTVSDLDNQVSARAVGFALAPRLNAAGRMGKADSGFHLLTSVDLKEATQFAERIDAINQERKNIQEQVQDEVEYLISREINLKEDRVIVLASKNFHSGVIGIVASRIVEKYFRPVVLIAFEGLIGKGSGRSIPQFNLHRAFTDCASHLVQFGGHAYAAGLTIKEENLGLFRNKIKKVGRQFLNEENLVPEIILDKKLNISEINQELYKHITLLEPFGSENPPPIFLIQAVRISMFKKIGREQNHVRFQANQHDAKIDAVGFNLAEEFASIDLELNKVDLVCEFQINDWNGGNKLELKILDLCCSVEKN
jgi:single-stranded-DNA-specific exonuclease